MSEFIGKALLNRYQIRKHIGRGGMAEVFEVWDKKLSAPLAMKLLHREIAQDRVFQRRFEREARTLAKLQHPNIVRFYGLEREGMDTFILMDLVEGVSLKSEIYALDGKSMGAVRILEIMSAICSALQFAHTMSIVHSDLKPANVLIPESGRIKVADFGIARVMDAATATMVGAGTPAYMSPEQIKGQAPTPQSDIYALGVILYEMVTGGERPFTGEQATITGSTSEKVRWEHLNIKAPKLPKKFAKGNKGIESIILRCLEKDPAKRFENPMELLNAISKIKSDPKAPLQLPEEKPAPSPIKVAKKAQPKKLDVSNPWVFLLLWTGTYSFVMPLLTLGLQTGTLRFLYSFPDVMNFFLGGVLTGFLQWLVLRKRLGISKMWIILTGLGMTFPFGFVDFMRYRGIAPPWLGPIIYGVLFTILGGFIVLAQWVELRKHMEKANTWVAVGSFCGFGAALIVSLLMLQRFFLFFLLFCTLFGFFTGLVLLFLIMPGGRKKIYI